MANGDHEIVFYELMVNTPVRRPLLTDYPDHKLYENTMISCYSITEVIAEKFRALLQRSYPAPRDYYDLWKLLQNTELLERKDIVSTFSQKAKYKNIEFHDYTDFFNPDQLRKVKQAWNNSLRNHLREDALPDFNTVIAELKSICNSQFNKFAL